MDGTNQNLETHHYKAQNTMGMFENYHSSYVHVYHKYRIVANFKYFLWLVNFSMGVSLHGLQRSNGILPIVLDKPVSLQRLQLSREL